MTGPESSTDSDASGDRPSPSDRGSKSDSDASVRSTPESTTESTTGSTTGSTTTVVAQGTFDILHPGHVHYLEDAADRGDELHVVVARSSNVTHKAPPVVPARQRRDVVAALEAVDHARLGDPEDIFVPIEEIEPDVIVLGYDQHHDEEELAAELEERGLDCEIARASPRPERYEGELLSTGRIVERVLEERG